MNRDFKVFLQSSRWNAARHLASGGGSTIVAGVGFARVRGIQRDLSRPCGDR
jgi:hypothetical protein